MYYNICPLKFDCQYVYDSNWIVIIEVHWRKLITSNSTSVVILGIKHRSLDICDTPGIFSWYISNTSTSLGSCYIHLVQVPAIQISTLVLDTHHHYFDTVIESVVKLMFQKYKFYSFISYAKIKFWLIAKPDFKDQNYMNT